METYSIKILRDTPFDKEGDIISLSTFRMKYGYVCTKDVSDIDIVQYLEQENHLYRIEETPNSISKWFKLIKKFEFTVGEWVWHEKLKKAFHICNYSSGQRFRPNNCTIEAVNDNPKIYKRLATVDEIERSMLTYFAQDKVLIGKYDVCYYFDYVWKSVSGVKQAVLQYIQLKDSLKSLSINISFEPNPDVTSCKITIPGLSVGCLKFTDEEVMQIAKVLGITA